jgi:hypothetical protein
MNLALGMWIATLGLTACGAGKNGGAISTATAPPAVSTAQVVFESPGIPGGGSIQEIYTANVDGSSITQLTHDGLSKFLAHFSPDATHLIYSKFYSGQYGDPEPTTDVAVFDFGTGQETRITRTGNAFQPVWSPDGTHIAYGLYNGGGLYTANADGSEPLSLGQPSGADDDLRWDDFAWSSDNWILFTVGQNTNNCFKVRLDKIRPDGTARTQVTDGGPSCTPTGMQQYGDADPGFSADGQTIYSSRGIGPVPENPSETLRHLYSFSSDAWIPGKVETDLSLGSQPDCVVGVPKGSPDGSLILTFLACPETPQTSGVTLTDTDGSFWNFVAGGFGADWNPGWKR